MKISENGLNLIKSFEGCRLIAYKALPSEKYFTIGYGHMGADVKENMVISQAQADRYLQQDIERFEKYVNQYCGSLALNQNQYDALTSFTFNCGAGNLKKLIEGRTVAQIADALLLYNHAGGKEIAGLTRRRKAERELFIKRDVLIVIGSARIDENGNVTNGAAGDQKQKDSSDYTGEVSMQQFYLHKKGWYVLRPKDPEIAEKIAEAMKRACNNVNIGYSQSDRASIIRWGTWAEKPCNCDCSSLMRECIIEASGKDPGNFNTGNEALYLLASGLFEDKIEYTSNMNLFVGDVLVTKTKGHTVAVVEGNIRNLAKNDISEKKESGAVKMSKLSVQMPTIRKGSKGKAVRILQALLYINVTGEFDQNTEDSCKFFQNKSKLVPDGIAGVKTWKEILKDL